MWRELVLANGIASVNFSGGVHGFDLSSSSNVEGARSSLINVNFSGGIGEFGLSSSSSSSRLTAWSSQTQTHTHKGRKKKEPKKGKV
jgi:hypothetical protein